MRNSLARRVLWVHVILLLALCGVLLRIFVIGQGDSTAKPPRRRAAIPFRPVRRAAISTIAGCAHW